jgi:hypothetical protein
MSLLHQKDTAGPEDRSRGVDVIKAYQWSEYNLMTIKIWRIPQIKAVVVAKAKGIVSKVVRRYSEGGQGAGALETKRG